MEHPKIKTFRIALFWFVINYLYADCCSELLLCKKLFLSRLCTWNEHNKIIFLCFRFRRIHTGFSQNFGSHNMPLQVIRSSNFFGAFTGTDIQSLGSSLLCHAFHVRMIAKLRFFTHCPNINFCNLIRAFDLWWSYNCPHISLYR